MIADEGGLATAPCAVGCVLAPPRFDDTTLRDGEQAAYVVFSYAEKLRIAHMLDEIGVDQIETGIPAMGGDEYRLVEQLAQEELRCSVLGWSRAVLADIDMTLDTGVDAIEISLATSDLHINSKLHKDRCWVLNTIGRCVSHAKERGAYVCVGAEDASRTDPAFLLEYAQTAQAAGADRIRYCDTVGLMEPFRLHAAIAALCAAVDLEVEVHTHNDFGLAVANALAAWKGGATWINTTVGGLGERAGNAALEPTIMALRHLEGLPLERFDTRRFTECARFVARAASREVGVSQPVVGAYVFAHESGIHVDGLMKDSHTYEAFEPLEVGGQRAILVGKHSGSHALMLKFSAHGFELAAEQAAALLPHVRAEAIRRKRPLYDDELLDLYHGLAPV
ncbi:MAG: homocitrate synthase [Coriobacteriales bacterium]|jgi:homocitrate synthase NifV|nr:homocitrate synthase [Coriobacteriales bacterium]